MNFSQNGFVYNTILPNFSVALITQLIESINYITAIKIYNFALNNVNVMYNAWNYITFILL